MQHHSLPANTNSLAQQPRQQPQQNSLTAASLWSVTHTAVRRVRMSYMKLSSGPPSHGGAASQGLRGPCEAPSTGRIRQVLGQAAALTARCCFTAMLIALFAWLLGLGSPLHWRIATGHIQLPAAAASLHESRVFDSSMLWRDVVCLWLVPAVLALSAVAMLVLQPMVRQRLVRHDSSSPSRWAAQLVPPRALWQWVCGGLTVGDLLVLCIWAAINISWFSAALGYYQHKAALKAAANGLASLTGQQLAKAAARSFGATLAPNLVLLFYPVSRGSAVLQVLGLSYPAGIRYHRALGHGVLTLVALHGLTYHLVWLASGQWVAKALDQGPGHNNLLGSVAFVFGLALWLTSLEAVRRANYAQFKVVHHIGFWGFLVFGVCHKWDLVWAFLPGLVMYGADAAYRIYQAFVQPAFGLAGDVGVSSSGSATSVLHASVSPGGGLCTLVLACPDFAAAASGYVWLSVPALSWYEYHPFEYVAVPWRDGGAGRSRTGLLVHIKAYSRWTQQLVSLLSIKGEKVDVNMQGPYCELPRTLMPPAAARSHHHTPDAIVIIAGGNGISSAASVFTELAAAAVATPGLPCLLVWASRSAAELETMGPLVLAMARALQLQLTTKLFFTGTLPPPPPSTAAQPPRTESLQLPSSPHHAINLTATPDAVSEHTALLGADASDESPTATVTVSHCAYSLPEGGGASSSVGGLAVSSLCPVVALGSWWCQAAHKLAMHVVVFAGALCALALGCYIQDTQRAVRGSNWPTAKAGMLYVALLVVLVLVPALLTIWVSLLLLKLQRSPTKRSSSSSSTQGVKGHTPAATAAAVEAGLFSTRSSGSLAALSAVSAAAAGAVGPGRMGRLLAAADGSLRLQLPAAAPQQQQDPQSSCTTGSSCAQDATQLASSDARQSVPAADGGGAGIAQCIPVECGRPALAQLVKGWLSTQQQQLSGRPHHQHSKSSSSSHRQHRCTVYGMGPERLVLEAHELCSGVSGVCFVRKTHQL